MMIILIAILMVVLAYLYGGFSTARIIAKSARSLNIYKVGTGLADTENIYSNVSKPMGVLVGGIDAVKSYVFLLLAETILRYISKLNVPSDLDLLYSSSFLLIYGLAMLIGHCLPIRNHLRGGRGIFTYMGFIGYFAFYPMLITVVLAWVVVTFFRQIRFAQYMIVILPVIFTQFLYAILPWFRKEFPPHFMLLLLAITFVMGFLNILVSKRLGEF